MLSVDADTTRAYRGNAAGYAEEWESQPPPEDMYELLERFFRPGTAADIGCGSGRDTAWLVARGWPAVGYDGSRELIREARSRHPSIRFAYDSLPELDAIADESFANVLCETVIMHLQPAQIGAAVRRLLAIAEPAGIVYTSWRVTGGEDVRDGSGRLYSAFDAELVRSALRDAETLYDREEKSDSSGKLIHRLIVRKEPASGA